MLYPIPSPSHMKSFTSLSVYIHKSYKIVPYNLKLKIIVSILGMNQFSPKVSYFKFELIPFDQET